MVGGLCAAIASLELAHAASLVAPMLTVSVGGVTMDSRAAESAAALFEAADEQLYRAKDAGRNRVAWREG
jgi:PleD family two-component response regulator